ncbi:MAG TPA: TIR domain-containing protein [Ktedonobacteraceae bacterium]|jgi:predicted nucleotide-binding protein|nr:TIR domain-containing protein [Ktedonobacteraceae bacterium]
MRAKKPEPSEDISRNVYLVHGQNSAATRAMCEFLQSLELVPITKETVVKLMGETAPFIGQIIDAAFEHANAVIVLFTGDDLARLRSDLQKDSEKAAGRDFAYQPGQDQVFEAGYAFGRYPEHTILLQLGNMQLFSDIDGMYIPIFTGKEDERRSLIDKLKKVGCTLKDDGDKWRKAGNFRKALRKDTPPTH